jgi:hypothetical protein
VSSVAPGSAETNLAKATAATTEAPSPTGKTTGSSRAVSREMRHAGRLTGFAACAGWKPMADPFVGPGAAPGHSKFRVSRLIMPAAAKDARSVY